MPPLQPSLPANQGGNNPAVTAAMSRQRMGAPSAGADPSQIGSAQQGPQGAGQGVGALLAQALQLYVAGGASPGDTEQIRQFFEAFVDIARQTQEGVQAGAAPAGGPQLGAGTAPMAPQPGAVAPPIPG